MICLLEATGSIETTREGVDADRGDPNSISVVIGGDSPVDSTGNDFVDGLPSDAPSTTPKDVPLGSFSGSVLADIDNDKDGDEPLEGVLVALIGEDGVIYCCNDHD